MEKDELVKESVEIAGKTALSLIPIGGTLITCVWDSIKANTAEKRLQKWKEFVENRLNKIEDTLDDIGNNELFTSAIMRATDIALKTAESEKHEYLANAVYNSVNIDIEEALLMIYLDLLEKYTVWHLQTLFYFRNPQENSKLDVSNYMIGSVIEPLRSYLPDLCQDKDLVMKIVKDLQQDGLLTQGDYLNTSMSPQGMLASRTTQLGNKFLDYILLR